MPMMKKARRPEKAREEAAKERIYSLLPEDQKEELAAIFDEFEESKTPESKLPMQWTIFSH